MRRRGGSVIDRHHGAEADDGGAEHGDGDSRGAEQRVHDGDPPGSTVACSQRRPIGLTRSWQPGDDPPVVISERPARRRSRSVVNCTAT